MWHYTKKLAHLVSRFTHCCLLGLLGASAVAAGDFRVYPYLQNPTDDGLSIIWFTDTDEPGTLTVKSNANLVAEHESSPQVAPALAYTSWENDKYFAGNAPAAPYKHRVRVTNLAPTTRYNYTVEQGTSSFQAAFTTLPGERQKLRLIALADCETEPESSGKFVSWQSPLDAQLDRPYLVDQSTGLAGNLAVVRSRRPHLVTLSGDLVEAGGEQRDWDEFWRHFAAPASGPSLAGSIALLPALGNHEYFAGLQSGRYQQPASEQAVARYLSYFELPESGGEGRYYHLTAGALSIIALDVTNGFPAGSAMDTNYFLAGNTDAQPGRSPGFAPGSKQYQWLLNALSVAQRTSAFTMVILHHSAYSAGEHGAPPGRGGDEDPQSGVPVRVLSPPFLEYGVDMVLSGHDEMWERSTLTGIEKLPGGGSRQHTIHFYDVGTCGDGLRGPRPGLVNPRQAFLAHTDAPERWKDGVLIDGGKHYGHLEVEIVAQGTDSWTATLTPVYVFPLVEKNGEIQGFERRFYKDVVRLTAP